MTMTDAAVQAARRLRRSIALPPAGGPRLLLRGLGHLRFLRFGVRDRLIRRLCDPQRCSARPFTVPFFGARYSGRFDSYIDWSVYFYGGYAREELRLLGDLLGAMQRPVMLDVGANVGNHTLYAALRAHAVVAFEPWPVAAAQLQRKLVENRVDNVRLRPCALGDEAGVALYRPPATRNGGTGSFVGTLDGATDAPLQALPLPVRRGDDVIAEERLARVHLVKIDTEGFEPFVLRGLERTLRTQRPVVLFEWTQEGRRLHAACDPSLFPPDYAFYQFVGDRVVGRMFRKLGYALQPLAERWPDGQVLALPREQIAALGNANPRLARVLRDAAATDTLQELA